MAKLDRQRKRLYKWEGEWPTFDRRIMTIEECRKVVRWACRLYKVKMPTVFTHTKKKGSSFSCDEPYVICLNRKHQNIAISLHEAAHTIHTALMGEIHETHGPEFLSIYLNLLLRIRVWSPRALVLSMKHHRLKWRPLAQLSPTRIRKTYRRVIANKNKQD